MIPDELGWASTLVMGIVGVGGLVSFARWRALRHPDGWGLGDVAVAGAALVWGSALGGLLAWRMVDGGWTPTENTEIPLSVAIAGTAFGSSLAAGFALGRAGPDALGFLPVRARAYGAALGWLVPFWAFSLIWSWFVEQQGPGPVEQDLLTEVRRAWGTPVGAGALLYGVLFAPVLEELLFRGFALPPLSRRLGSWGGAAANGLLFGALHFADPWSVVPLTVLGVLLARSRQTSGGLGPPILTHMVNNAFVFFTALYLPDL